MSITDIREQKAVAVAKRFAIKVTPFLMEALFVAQYENKAQTGMPNNVQSKEVDNPNRKLANVGDRVLKLVLTERKYLDGAKTVQEINDDTNENEKNKKLAELKIIDDSYGYCEVSGEFTDNMKDNPLVLATMVEAIIGAIYLSEMQAQGTFVEARRFIEKYIIKGGGK
jgi:dsRNA-specific ribonuclease